MRLLTIVEDYVHAAMKKAEIEQLEDGTIAAYVPACPGILAFGADVHECAVDLYARLGDWVRVSLVSGHELPAIEGIDLNSNAEHILATYFERGCRPDSGEFYANEQELESAFAKRSKRG